MVLSRRKCTASMLSVCVLLMAPLVSSFQPSSRALSISSPPSGGRPSYQDVVNPLDRSQPVTTGSSTSLNSFMGSDGGLFGIGTPELATILIVGYFVLGPSDLYKLVKEIGKFIQNVRTLGNEATKNFENSMESQLELQELRKAQRELNDAFSFRRSINVDDDGEAFSTNVQSPRGEEVPVAAAAAATTTTAAEDAPAVRKKKRRRVKKKALEPTAPINNNVPDLDMSDTTMMPATTRKEEDKEDDAWFADGSADEKMPSAAEMAREDLEWLKESETTTTPAVMETKDPKVETAEQSRFQQQLSGNWNQMVLENEDKLGPMALVMEQLALLEDEKAAADKRLEEEFTKRFQQEEEFYRKKRELLEEAAAKVQKEAYVTMEGGSKK